MKEYKIYKLIDPRDQKIRYIGVTTRTLNQRLAAHYHEGKYYSNTHKVYWIKELFNQNLKPIIELVEICNENNWEEREKYWISFYNNLTNTSLGGVGIVFKTENSISNSSQKHYKEILQLDIQLNIINEFPSVKEASKLLNISRTNIGNVLKQRALTAGGFHFIYRKDYTSNYRIDTSSSNGVKIKQDIKVIFNDDSFKIYNSQCEFANDFNINPSFVSMLLKNIRKLDKSKKLSNIKSIQHIKI